MMLSKIEFSEFSKLKPYDIDAAYDRIKKCAIKKINDVVIKSQIRFLETFSKSFQEMVEKVKN